MHKFIRQNVRTHSPFYISDIPTNDLLEIKLYDAKNSAKVVSKFLKHLLGPTIKHMQTHIPGFPLHIGSSPPPPLPHAVPDAKRPPHQHLPGGRRQRPSTCPSWELGGSGSLFSAIRYQTNRPCNSRPFRTPSDTGLLRAFIFLPCCIPPRNQSHTQYERLFPT